MRGVVAVAVAGLVLLAGCGELVTQDQPAIDETVTPAPVPSTPTPAPEVAPGISQDGVDAVAVSERHEAALDGEAYTLRLTAQRGGTNDTAVGGQTVVKTDPDADQYFTTERYPVARGPFNQTGFAVWYDGDHSFVRTTFATGPPEHQRFSGPVREPDASTPVVRDLFSRLTVTQVSREDDGSTVVRGSLNPVAGTGGLGQVSDSTNGSMSARVHADGYVEHLVVGYDAPVNTSAERVREEMTITDVGETTVTEPDWAENASATGSVAVDE